MDDFTRDSVAENGREDWSKSTKKRAGTTGETHDVNRDTEGREETGGE